jgi:hypothetical protein
MKGFQQSVMHPFTNSRAQDGLFFASLDAQGKAMFKVAVERRGNILKALGDHFKNMTAAERKEYQAAVQKFDDSGRDRTLQIRQEIEAERAKDADSED